MCEPTKPTIGVYPGTFDPITNGHIDIIERALHLFDKVIIAVAVNSKKDPLFDASERVAIIEKCFEDKKDRIEVVEISSGLLVDFAMKKNAKALIRGLRAVSDFDYEFQLALMNRKLVREVESIFLMTAFRWIYISSSMIKEVARNGGDVSDLVPSHINTLLKDKYSEDVG